MIAFPLVYPSFTAVMFQFGSKGVVSIGLSPFFYLTSALWVFSGIGIQSLKHWSWYTFTVAQVLTVYLNAWSLVANSESEFKVIVFGLMLLIQFVAYTLVAREMRVPYLFSRIKWWESGIAGMHHVPARIVCGASPEVGVQALLLDVSSRGCFLKNPADFPFGETVRIRISAYGQSVDLPGRIVWNAKSSVTHPKGIGVRFDPLERGLRRRLKILAKQFNQEKALTRGLPVISS
jgi:Tfp pilus assembly protein PilZ